MRKASREMDAVFALEVFDKAPYITVSFTRPDISENGECPEGMCPAAWYSMREFVESLARGEGNFYDGWMKNPMSAMISCNDGFRPFSFYIEVIE